MRRQSFTTANEFIDFLLTGPLFQVRHVRETVSWGTREFIFRGHASSDWQLIPAAFRPGNPFADFTPQTPGQAAPSLKDAKGYLGWHLMAELRAVRIFLEQADRLGIPTPLDYTTASAHIELIQAALNEEEYNYGSPFPLAALLPGIALAQHYGVPTRLLDWTESPLVAAYFAAEPHSKVAQRSPLDSDTIIVYALDRRLLYSDEEFATAAAPRYMNPNLRAQKGVFTYLPKANDIFARTAVWPSMEYMLEEHPSWRAGIHAYELPSGEADNLLRLLYRYDVTRYHLFPSLENAASSFAYNRALFGDLEGPKVFIGSTGLSGAAQGDA